MTSLLSARQATNLLVERNYLAYLVVLAVLGWFWAVARLTKRMSV